jgi:hypothetical protein
MTMTSDSVSGPCNLCGRIDRLLESRLNVYISVNSEIIP